jgi:hypothetical protein
LSEGEESVVTLKEWKARLQPGARFRQIRNGRGECNHVLTVVKVQRNAMKVAPNNGFIAFPKRDEIVFTENGWQRLTAPGSSGITGRRT